MRAVYLPRGARPLAHAKQRLPCGAFVMRAPLRTLYGACSVAHALRRARCGVRCVSRALRRAPCGERYAAHALWRML